MEEQEAARHFFIIKADIIIDDVKHGLVAQQVRARA